MKRLLPSDKKALAMAAWLFYAERGFDAQLLHPQHKTLNLNYRISSNLSRRAAKERR